MKSKAILVLLFSSAQLSHSQTLDRHNQKFAWIDSAVFLMENIAALSIRDDSDKLIGYKKSHLKYSNTIQWLISNQIKSCGFKSLAQLAFCIVTQLEDELSKDFALKPEHRIALASLYAHTKRLFEHEMYGGTVFDETIHIQYYQHRLRILQLLDQERFEQRVNQRLTHLEECLANLETRLTAQIKNGLSDLDKSLKGEFSYLNSTMNQTKTFTQNQQRDQMVTQITSRKKWQRKARAVEGSTIERILTSGKSRYKMKQELKRSIRSTPKQS
ncbi:MAG: hypothetical protein JNL17_09955 [Cyclobacteriaceae bacterium]|nr:hypothetical protein [Cyclobacteriaceae bacterium]